MDFSNGYLYVADTGSNKLVAINIQNVKGLKSVGTVALTGVTSISCNARYCFTIDPTNGLSQYQISQANGTLGSAIDSTIGSMITPTNVKVKGDYVYVLDQSGLTAGIWTFPAVSDVNTVSVVNSFFSGEHYLNSMDVGDNVVGGSESNSNAYAGLANRLIVQDVNAGNVDVGILDVQQNANISGELKVTGGAVIGGATQIGGDTSVTGSFTVASSTASSLTYFNVNSANGNTGIGTSTPANAGLTVTSGDVYITDATKGFIEKDTVSGTCYRIQMTSGSLTPTALGSCP